MDVDISSWDKRNVGVTPSGEYVVRQSFSAEQFIEDTGTVLFAYTVKCQSTNENWHYILFLRTGNTIELQFWNDNFVNIETFTYNTNAQVRAFSCSVLEDMVLFTSPDLPAVFSIVGGNMVLAIKQD